MAMAARKPIPPALHLCCSFERIPSCSLSYVYTFKSILLYGINSAHVYSLFIILFLHLYRSLDTDNMQIYHRFIVIIYLVMKVRDMMTILSSMDRIHSNLDKLQHKFIYKLRFDLIRLLF